MADLIYIKCTALPWITVLAEVQPNVISLVVDTTSFLYTLFILLCNCKVYFCNKVAIKYSLTYLPFFHWSVKIHMACCNGLKVTVAHLDFENSLEKFAVWMDFCCCFGVFCIPNPFSQDKSNQIAKSRLKG